MAKILLLGARGMLGRRLHEVLEPAHAVTATAFGDTAGLPALDVTDAAAIGEAVASLRPDWIVNACAYTAVDRAEDEPEAAFAVNRDGPANLARAAAATGAALLHVSTDFVFDGRKETAYVESDPTGALSVYGRSKEAGETEVRRLLEDHLVVRISWLFGPDGPNFVDTMRRLAGGRDHLRVVDDQRGTPTFTVDAARVMARLIDEGARGTVHAANRGETTWCGLAREVLRGIGSATVVEAIRTEDWPTAAPRPANSALRNRILEETMGHFARPWQEALSDHLARSEGA